MQTLRKEDFLKSRVIAGRYAHLKQAAIVSPKSGYRMEFGVHTGATINFLAATFDTETWWGFDSFKGLPETWVRSNDGRRKSDRGEFALSKPPRVEHNVELIVGLLKDTLPVWSDQFDGPISFMHIDSDLYSSCNTILHNLNDKIVPGTVIVLDELCDWLDQGVYERWQEGEWSAMNDWMHDRAREIQVLSRTNWIEGAVVVTK